MSKYQHITLKQIQNNPAFNGKKVFLEGRVRGLCYKPGNFLGTRTRYEGLLEQGDLTIGFVGKDHFDRFAVTRLLKASSETGLPVKLKGNLRGKPDQYELYVVGVHYQGNNVLFIE